MRKLILFLSVLIPVATFTDDSVFFTLLVQPDVMMILDCSGSMTYDMSGNYTWGDGSEYYPGRDTDGNGYPDDSRMYIAKNAIHRIVSKRDQFRWGLETYPGQTKRNVYADWYRDPPYWTQPAQIPWDYTGSGYDNGQIQVNIAEAEPAHLNSIYILIDHLKKEQELRAQGGTPIGGALYVARQFYVGEIHSDNAKACRRYFCVLVSDGAETGYPNYNSHSPYQEARNLRYTYVDGLEYDVQTYVIGVAISGGPEAQCLDSIAKMGGTVHYYPATSPAALDSVLDVIASDIIQKSFAFSAPEVPAVRLKQHDKMFIGSFVPSFLSFWEGHLKCYRLTPEGIIPVDSLGVPTETPLWDAGEVLQSTSSSSRTIYTEMGGNLVPFVSYLIPAETLGVPTDSVDELVNWVRGDNGMGWKLPDIYHSEPVAITNPNPFYFEEGFNEFKRTYTNRDRVIIAGSNGGILHAFDAGTYSAVTDSFTDGTGNEIWGFIPGNLLPLLKDTRNSHRNMVDGSPSAADVWIPSSSSDSTKDADEWKTILVCGERSGGNYYFSLDITNTYSPLFMWDFTDVDIGETWSGSIITKVRLPNDKWVSVFGGGYDPDNIKGKALYVIDVTDANIIKKFDSSDHSDLIYCMPSSPTGLDIPPLDCYLDKIYIGDAGGQMWRFDVSDTSVSSWTGSVIFAAPPGNPMFYPPAMSYDNNKNLWVFFGTGDRENPREGASQNRYYGIIDMGITLKEANIKDITNGPAGPYTNGWYIKLDKGEKVLAGSVVLGGTVFFTTYMPVELDDPCSITGLAKLYRVNFMTGAYDVDTIGASLPTTPQLTISTEGVFTVMISLAEGEVFSQIYEGEAPFKEIIHWREIRP